MTRTKPLLRCFTILCLAVITLACEDEEQPERPNISGTLTYKGENFQMKGGLLDEKSDSTFYRTTFEFKVSDRPIHQTIRKVFEIYARSSRISMKQERSTSNGSMP